ncbi:MAG: glycosyltransferase family 4 protein [Anaerolineae bacterium]|nr:glycosyltransferase family 4 protein [Anaerolineae bacterium]
MINLLFVSSYVDLGGGETALLTLADQFDPTQFTPHLLVPCEGQLAAAWRARGWAVHVMPWRGATTYFIPAIWARLPISRRIEALIREQKIDLLHSDYHTLPMALPAAERAGIPTLWTCMGWWFHPQFWQRGFFQRPDVIFAHSQAIKDGFLGQPPFMSPERITILYPGVDTRRFHPGVDGIKVRFEAGFDKDAPVVALVARFQDVKGHDVFQAMARQVALQIPAARFVVAGENTQTSADNAYKTRILEVMQTDPLLRSRLKYLGFRADVERVLAAADVVVCSSHFESYGLTVVEAMACGKPVVSTNRGGPSETVVHGETGFLVPPGDAAGLARYVIDLLRDADLRERMGVAGQARVEKLFTAEVTGKIFTTEAQSALSFHRGNSKK